MGNMSVYGDLSVEYISGAGIIKQVGIVKGIAVYTPNPVRKFQMDLDNKAKVDYHSGSIRVTFSSQSEPKSEKFAEAELKLN